MILNDGETTNYQLIEMAQRVGIPLRKVAFKDQLRRHHPESGAYIINMEDSSAGEGSHWVGLYLTRHANRAVAFYFDSYGTPAPEAVLAFAKEFGAPILIYSNEQIQGIKSNYCGQYVMNWLYYMARMKGPPDERYKKFLKQYNPVRFF